MSTTIVSEAMVMTAGDSSQSVTNNLTSQSEVDFVKCDCCGLTEECTPPYIQRIRERYQGKWICGLCGEAVKDEIVRSERLLSTEEALNRHINFCSQFQSAGPPVNPAFHLISAVRQILRRSFDSPRSLRSTPNSPTKNHDRGLARSESCIPTLSMVTQSSAYMEEGSG